MRLILSLATLALVAGCSTVSTVREAWSWDPTRMQERTPVVRSPEQLAQLSNRLAELQMRRNEIRSRISAEPDIRARQRLYEELHTVGRELSPLGRQLTAMAAP